MTLHGLNAAGSYFSPFSSLLTLKCFLHNPSQRACFLLLQPKTLQQLGFFSGKAELKCPTHIMERKTGFTHGCWLQPPLASLALRLFWYCFLFLSLSAALVLFVVPNFFMELTRLQFMVAASERFSLSVSWLRASLSSSRELAQAWRGRGVAGMRGRKLLVGDNSSKNCDCRFVGLERCR